ncbi:MAG: radical SAM family heme chaperone HemW [Candidatus Delongbacteria bacterium]|jgi:oxygen-independent coproporphyrinogen-3 oxidase|nr:radical SAM family heme chaperone HemW [Candidatus Delongbacteria bacterium]
MRTDHIYIHFPFCKKKCPYCDFFSLVSGNMKEYREYIDHLHKEADLYQGYFSDNIRTVYFGGGTPSLMDPDDLREILLRFKTGGYAEVTLEVNPATADYGKLKAFMEAGVTRLSVGSQSFIDAELRTLGRIHGVNDIYEVYEAARKAGCGNMNLDLITGIPGSSPAGALYSASELCRLGPEHVSVYILTYYEGTPFTSLLSSGRLKKLEDDVEIELFSLAAGVLARYGFERYEISNFSKPGRRSAHNMNTWDFGNYIGLGASAHSFLEKFRWENPQDLASYNKKVETRSSGIITENKVKETDLKNEFLMLGLRKISGLNVNDYAKIFGTPVGSDFEKLDYYINKGVLLCGNDTIRLPQNMLDVFNSVVSDIII